MNQHLFPDHLFTKTVLFIAGWLRRNNMRHGPLNIALALFLKTEIALPIFTHLSNFVKALLSVWHWASGQGSEYGKFKVLHQESQNLPFSLISQLLPYLWPRMSDPMFRFSLGPMARGLGFFFSLQNPQLSLSAQSTSS